jgi:hypothetical protein
MMFIPIMFYKFYRLFDNDHPYLMKTIEMIYLMKIKSPLRMIESLIMTNIRNDGYWMEYDVSVICHIIMFYPMIIWLFSVLWNMMFLECDHHYHCYHYLKMIIVI